MSMAWHKGTIFLVMAAVLLLATPGLGAEPLFIERKSVKIALGTDDLFHGYVQLAAAMGLLGQHGLDVQLLITHSAERAAESVIQGRCLFGIHEFQQVLLAREREQPLVAISKAMDGPGLQIVARDAAVAGAWVSPQLRGKKKFALLKDKLIGIDAADELQAPWLQWRAEMAGLDAQKELRMVDAGSGAEGIAALESGAVDYLVTRPPTGEMIHYMGTGRIVWLGGDKPEELRPLYLVVSMREDSGKAYPDMPGKFLRAMRSSFVLMHQQQERTFSTARRLWPRVPEAALRQAVANSLQLLPWDLALKKDEVRLTIKLMLKAGLLNREITMEEACAIQFLR